MNHVGSMYGVMDDVFVFAGSFKDFPPRSHPPSFNPANILEETLDSIRRRQQTIRSIDRIRPGTGETIERILRERAAQ